MALVIKNLPAMQGLLEMWVRSLGQEDPLEEKIAPFQYFCLGNPMNRGACRATRSPWGGEELDMT